MGQGKLYIIPTPIGNLEDMTLRAIRILKEVDLILAEDTRTSSVLLRHYEITTKTISHHKFNEHEAVKKIVQEISDGKNIALISDAGTPGISCLLYTSDAADERSSVDLGGRRIIKKKK